MKFAKELEEGLVPEWRAKYFDYKTGKKKLKAVARALRGVTGTPRTLKGRSSFFAETSLFGGYSSHSSPYQTVPPHSFLRRSRATPGQLGGETHLPHDAPSPHHRSRPLTYPNGDERDLHDRGISFGNRRSERFRSYCGPIDEHSTLRESQTETTYGSIIPTPPDNPAPTPAPPPPTLLLPDPALDPGDGSSAQRSPQSTEATIVPAPSRINSVTDSVESPGSAYGNCSTVAASSVGATRTRRLFRAPRRSISTPVQFSPRPLFQRFLSQRHSAARSRGGLTPQTRDAQLDAYREFDLRQAQFFAWMDDELQKIESFYKMKEDEANGRIRVLKAQLHEMRDRRFAEMVRLKQTRHRSNDHGEDAMLLATERQLSGGEPRKEDHLRGLSWLRPIREALHLGQDNTEACHDGTRQASGNMRSPPGGSAQPLSEQQHRTDNNRDFVRRRPSSDSVPYRQAKRKLKAALSEYYRGLELLKSYALLNRTAFRKMNKKYDKMVHTYHTGRYMVEKVNKAWFVQSAVLDGNMRAVEDLYARYFERGNHKVAVSKLRSKTDRAREYHGSAYRNGLFIGAGAVFGVQGLVQGVKLLHPPNSVLHFHTAYLLQIYAGYFLSISLFLLFCLACRLWTKAKINYVFIFEFDTRHHLDWRQLAELPCLFLFLEGLLLWLNFLKPGSDPLFLYYPVILIGLTIAILFVPAKIFYHRSRAWWLYSNWRLLLAGLYRVEFRDFLLGDMYCSQTYTMGNIELFFCLYGTRWSNPAQCNSTHSRLLGFFTTLPGIWRAMQCLRRYYDTRNVFPHLVNGGKYTFTILYCMTLSLYRINHAPGLKALFIFCAIVNTIYTSIWDLAMDWSLCNPYARHPFLRDVLGYKQTWMYYSAMILDPILRCNWIFYTIFTHDIQHSAVLSFFVALSEVFRRGMWTLFRVENEHCTNVGRFRASRDIPLPYDLPTQSGISGSNTVATTPWTNSPTKRTSSEATPAQPATPASLVAGTTRIAPHTSGLDLERAATQESTQTGYLRRRRSIGRETPQHSPIQRGLSRVGTLMAQAHAQDFERKKKAVGVDGEVKDDRDGIIVGGGAEEASSDDEEEEDTAEEELNEHSQEEGLDEEHQEGEGEGEEERDGPIAEI